MQTRRRTMVGCVVAVAACLSLAASALGAEAPAPDLTPVLGPKAAQWAVTNRNGGKTPHQTAKKNDRLALQAGPAGLALVSPDNYGPGTELSVTFLAAPERGWATLEFRAGVDGLTAKPEQGLSTSFAVQAGTDYLTWHVRDPLAADPKAAVVYGHYKPRGIAGRSLSWPDALRRIIEHEMTLLPPLDETWMTVRYVLLADGFRAYLNDRLLMERRAPQLKTNGRLCVFSSPGVFVTEVAVRPVEAVEPAFEPVPLRGYLNASRLNGQAVGAGALPAPEKIARVGGVPFQLPGADARGNDHIDVGVSWLQTGYLEGDIQPQGGEVGGRWAGAFNGNPSRIQLRVPGGRYRAVHVLAAADNEADSTLVITAQFYRPQCGFPRQFAARAPLFTAKADAQPSVPVKLADGTEGRLYLVTIPVDPGELWENDDLDHVEVELTKEVRLFRGYPDPTQYSFHAAGLPSAVHVFAVTLERPAVKMTVQPAVFGDAWVAPDQPKYNVRLEGLAGQAKDVTLTAETCSFDGQRKTRQEQTLKVPAAGPLDATFTLSPACHGYHDVIITLKDGPQQWAEKRSLAYHHADTRERGDWHEGRGPIFGFWNWNGGHRTPSGAQQVYLMGMAGAESSSDAFESEHVPEETRASARKWKMVTFKAFGPGDHWTTNQFREDLASLGLQKAQEKFLASLEKTKTKPSDIHRPELISFFAEPHIGTVTYGTLPSYYGDPDPALTESEEARYRTYQDAFVEGARIVKKHYPGVKCMLPHGDPLFPVYFLRRSEDVRKLIDGVTVDIPVFERLPEQQIHQVSLHRLYMCREEFKKAGLPKPILPMYEGPCRSSAPGALNERELADLSVRDSLILIAYGVERQVGGWCPAESGSYWGEQHYGGGIFRRLPKATPKPAYSAFATMTRHLNRRNLAKWLPTGSLSVYALQFTHYKTGDRMHVLWTIRGRRPVTLIVQPGGKVSAMDLMDNPMPVAEKDGRAALTVTTSPCFVSGWSGDGAIELGEPDHSDAAPAPDAVPLASLGDGSWRQSTDPDADYGESQADFIRRFPGNMTVQVVEAPAAQGGRAVSVALGKQTRDQKTMPYYTTLVPAKPVVIPGKGSHLGLWVRAASDWGRVVYAVRDAKGERWLSVGSKGEWNCDDIHNWSSFCFDGWRYLRFELPAHSPYDSYREKGSTWWGRYGDGDRIVDLPLTLEKIIVERRPYAMYVNDPQPARPDPVLLGEIYVEYERPEDKTDETVRLSRLRMPVPEGVPDLGNPIAEAAKLGVGAPPKITGIKLPDQHADGTQCHVLFDAVANAKSYDVWVSPYENGLGALKLGAAWTKPGAILRGLRPDTDFYIFLVYVDADGKPSKPSAPYKVRLKDMFGMK